MVLAGFLLVVGLGYLSALVQLHFQHAAPGQFLPDSMDLERTYAATAAPTSMLARLLETPAGPMNGTGTMRPAFFEKSQDWDRLSTELPLEEFQRLLDQREGERLALLHWVRAGGPRESYDQDDHLLGPAFATQQITEAFLVPERDRRQPALPKRVKIRTLIAQRCLVCHNPKGPEEHARLFPLEGYERLQPYCQVKAGQAMSLPKLAQTTHAHLLSFAVLFGLTGLVFSFTDYPSWVRCVVGLGPLVAQVAEIGCWWLARSEPLFAHGIWLFGVIVAAGLGAQIVGGVWALFDRTGRTVVAVLLLALAGTAAVVKWSVLDPHLESERWQAREQTH
ncbi:MAG: hypothetical protein AAB289_08655 [Chloroflexota bacterium]